MIYLLAKNYSFYGKKGITILREGKEVETKMGSRLVY